MGNDYANSPGPSNEFHYPRSKIVNITPLRNVSGACIGRFQVGTFTDQGFNLTEKVIKIELTDTITTSCKIYVKHEIRKNQKWKGWGAYEFLQVIGELRFNENFSALYEILRSCRLSDMGLSLAYSLLSDQMRIHLFLQTDKICRDMQSAATNIRKIFSYTFRRTSAGNAYSVFGPNILNKLMKIAHAEKEHLCQISDSSNPDEKQEDFNEIFRILKKGTIRSRGRNFNIRKSALASNLKKYQEDAVQFMIYRERMPALNMGNFLKSFVVSPIDNLLFFPCLGIFGYEDSLPIPCIRGGILADEMGLGKTVELLALINSVSPSDPDEPAGDRRQCQESQDIIDFVDFLVNTTTVAIDCKIEDPKISRQKICQNLYFNYVGEDCKSNSFTQTISCTECGITCSRRKMYWTNTLASSGTRFNCPDCVFQGPLIESAATLIVVPEILLHQWYEEIKRHVVDELTVDVYRGVMIDGYKHPQYLKSCNIVLCSYEILKKELDFSERHESKAHVLRKRPYETLKCITSPLVKLYWWRICADESQLVESVGSRAALMCLKLPCRARWCITGTPLMDGIQDFHGLLNFLQVFPFDNEQVFNSLLCNPWKSGNTTPLQHIVGQLFWRNTKDEVRDQLQIPQIRQTTQFLTFTPTEERFYQEKLLTCARKMEKLLRTVQIDPATVIADLPSKTQHLFMDVLNAVRLAVLTGDAHLTNSQCSTRDRHVYSPSALFARLVKIVRSRIEELTREYLMYLNAYAGLCSLYKQDDPQHLYEEALAVEDALEKLNEVIAEINRTAALSEKIKTIRLDATQVVHICRALMKIADDGQQCVRYPKDYLIERIDEAVLWFVRQEKSILAQTKSAWTDLERRWSRYDKAFDCYLSWILLTISKKSHLQNVHALMNVDAVGNLGKCLKRRLSMDNLSDCNLPFSLWIVIHSDFERFHGDFIALRRGFEDLAFPPLGYSKCEDIFTDDVLEMIGCSHNDIYDPDSEDRLPNSNREDEYSRISSASPTSQCRLCQLRRLLDKMQGVTVGVSVSSLSLVELRTLCRRLTVSTQNVAMSQQKEILRQWFELCNETLDICKKLYTYLAELVFRLRELKHAERCLEPGMQLSYQHCVTSQHGRLPRLCSRSITLTTQFSGEIQAVMNSFKANVDRSKADYLGSVAQLSYINSLRNCNETRECPVCYGEVLRQWHVFPCAHLICVLCYEQLLRNEPSSRIHCVSCRAGCLKEQVFLVSAAETNGNPIFAASFVDDDVKSLHLTMKYDALVRTLKQLLAASIQNKILIFTSLATAVGPLCGVLDAANISYLRIKGRSTNKTLDDFRNDLNSRVLVLHLGQSSNGLNLTQANHIIFTEPTTEKSVLKQAIGRIERMGQRQDMTVHNFVVKGTIEEEIYRLVHDVASPDGWTVGTLTTLFGL